MSTNPWLGGWQPSNAGSPSQLEALLAEVQALPDDPAFALLSPDERVAWLQNLRKLVDFTESVFLKCLGDFDAQGDAQTLNAATTTAGWLRSCIGLAPGDANERVRIARGFQHPLQEAGVALQSGSLSTSRSAPSSMPSAASRSPTKRLRQPSSPTSPASLTSWRCVPQVEKQAHAQP